MGIVHTIMTTVGGTISEKHSAHYANESDAKDAFTFYKHAFNATEQPASNHAFPKSTVLFFKQAIGSVKDENTKTEKEVIITRGILDHPRINLK